MLLHAPWYNSNTAHQGEAESVDMKKFMEGLLYQARVDVVFAGHVHAYERFVSPFPPFILFYKLARFFLKFLNSIESLKYVLKNLCIFQVNFTQIFKIIEIYLVIRYRKNEVDN